MVSVRQHDRADRGAARGLQSPATPSHNSGAEPYRVSVVAIVGTGKADDDSLRIIEGGRLESPTLDGCTGWILEAGLMKYLERVPVLFCENFGRSFETELFIPILSPRSGSVPCSRTFATRFKASKKSSLAIQRCLTI
jgi:hypothetical protein